MESDTTIIFVAVIFLKKATIIIAIHGQKTLQ